MPHLFSHDQVERLANRLASEASKDRPSAMTPNETRVVVGLLREDVERLISAQSSPMETKP